MFASKTVTPNWTITLREMYLGNRSGLYLVQSIRTKSVVEKEHASFQEGCFPFAKQLEVYINFSTDFLTSDNSINDAHKLESTSFESHPSASRYNPNNQDCKMIKDGAQSGHMNAAATAQEGHTVQK